jgi:hypothetical protein
VEEHGEKIDDEYWMIANLDKLPAFLLIVGRKDHGCRTFASALDAK